MCVHRPFLLPVRVPSRETHAHTQFICWHFSLCVPHFPHFPCRFPFLSFHFVSFRFIYDSTGVLHQPDNNNASNRCLRLSLSVKVSDGYVSRHPFHRQVAHPKNNMIHTRTHTHTLAYSHIPAIINKIKCAFVWANWIMCVWIPRFPSPHHPDRLCLPLPLSVFLIQFHLIPYKFASSTAMTISMELFAVMSPG